MLSSLLKILPVFCLIFCLAAFFSCSDAAPVPIKTGTAAENTDITAPDTSDRQYLPQEPADTHDRYLRPGNTYLIYAVNSQAAGYIEGEPIQDITGDGTATAVTAKANLGYKFIRWSDGTETAARSADTADKTRIITAIFDYDTLEMPVILIETETGEDVKSKTEYINACFSLLNCGREYEIDGLDITMRGRGNNTWSYEKKSYKFKLSEKKNLLGIGRGEAKTWVLLANMCDQSLLRNHTAFSFSKSLSGIAFAPASHSVEVYLNGEYRGVYLLAEEIQINKNRLDIDESTDGTDIGYLVEISSYADDNTVFYTAERKYHVVSDLSEDNELFREQLDYITGYLSECWRAVCGGNREEIESLIDIDSFVDTYIAEEVCKNLDFGFDSFYLHKDKGGKLSFGPIWDFDNALGNSNESCEYYYDFYAAVNAIPGLSNPWYYTIMKNRWFRDLVTQRWDEFESELDALPEEILENGQKYYNSFCRNFDKWRIFGRSMNRETKFITSLSTYTEHYTYLSEWVSNRIKWLDENIHSDYFAEGRFYTSAPVKTGNDQTESIMNGNEPLGTYIIRKSISGPEGYPNEDAANAFDGVESTKYCFNGNGVSDIFFSTSVPVTVRAYVFQTANDTETYTERNPDSWVLYGSSDPDAEKNGTWITLAAEPDGDSLMEPVNFTYYGMKVQKSESCRYFKLSIEDYEIVQFSEFMIYGEADK